MGGGRLREVVAHGGSTVYAQQRSCDYHYYQYTRPNRANVFHKEEIVSHEIMLRAANSIYRLHFAVWPAKNAF